SEESAELKDAQQRGGLSKYKTYARLAGPGWLQSALVLGGGSLAGSLYLGVLTGVNAIWLQPVAMVLTIIMFGALSYVVLSTGERPFQAINKHINPVLGWSWALAALVSCMVWAMPQYALASAVLQQNLAPGLLGADGPLGDMLSKAIIAGSFFVLVTAVAWRYSNSGRGVKIFEWSLKVMIYIVVACFIGVVVRLALLPGGLDWSGILQGIIPDPSLFFRPSEGFIPFLEGIPVEFRGFWEDVIVSRQREVIIAVAAAAGGVNATFLLAYSMLRRGWGKEYRGLAIFDLSTGMLIPFALVTTCVIIAASHQFHTAPQPGFVPIENGQEMVVEPSEAHVQEFEGLLEDRILFEASLSGNAELSSDEVAIQMGEISEPERLIAATLLTRDAIDLATSLEPLTGTLFARIIFGIGILGMTISTVVLHMLVSGMVICEMLGRPHTGWTLRIGSLAAATGILGPFLWQKAAFWLAIPTSIFAFILLPSAYFTFYLMLNKRSLMGKEMPSGYRGQILNIIMVLVIILFSVISVYVIWTSAGVWGLAALALFLAAIIAGHFSVKHNSQKVDEYQGHHD
ncbi:MAG: hypothetical protein WD625_12190, partial [Balneolales bacterium]